MTCPNCSGRAGTVFERRDGRLCCSDCAHVWGEVKGGIEPEAYARNSDPGTSHEAAELMSGQLGAQRMRQVLVALYSLGGEAISERIVEESGLTWQTATPRLRPLQRRELIEESGKEKASTGRPQIVWKLTDSGRRLVHELLSSG